MSRYFVVVILEIEAESPTSARRIAERETSLVTFEEACVVKVINPRDPGWKYND